MALVIVLGELDPYDDVGLAALQVRAMNWLKARGIEADQPAG